LWLSVLATPLVGSNIIYQYKYIYNKSQKLTPYIYFNSFPMQKEKENILSLPRFELWSLGWTMDPLASSATLLLLDKPCLAHIKMGMWPIFKINHKRSKIEVMTVKNLQLKYFKLNINFRYFFNSQSYLQFSRFLVNHVPGLLLSPGLIL
jgi:hypothetical protein